MLSERGDYESAMKVLQSIIHRNPTFKKASDLAESLKKNEKSGSPH